MRTGWKFVGLAAGMLALAPVAQAHELECEKTVNGETYLEISTFPVTLTYSLTVRNIHPDSASEVLEAEDSLLDAGFQTPFTLPYGEEETKIVEVTLDDLEDCEAFAAQDGSDDGRIDNSFTVRWDSGTDVCTARVVCVRPPPSEEDERRMTGGGSVFGRGRNRITHGFQLRCDEDDPRQNLEINFNGGDNFHLLDLTSAECIDDPNLDEENPVSGFDTFIGEGTGLFNQQPGYRIEFTFTDDGEPGKDDTAHMVIYDPSDNVVLDVEGTLQYGNHQAHPH